MSTMFNIKRRLLIGGPILIVLGLVIYLIRHTELVLVLSVIGIIVLIAGVIYKPRPKKAENAATEAQ